MRDSFIEVLHCGRLKGGHNEPTWAEVKLSLRYSSDRATQVEILEIREDGIISIVSDEPRILRLWHHQPETLVKIADGNHVYFQGSQRLLVDDRGSWCSFSMCPADERTQCDLF